MVTVGMIKRLVNKVFEVVRLGKMDLKVMMNDDKQDDDERQYDELKVYVKDDDDN